MIKLNVPLVIVRSITFWYQKAAICVKWGKLNSTYFNVSNGVQQGGELSSTFIIKNVDDLSR